MRRDLLELRRVALALDAARQERQRAGEVFAGETGVGMPPPVDVAQVRTDHRRRARIRRCRRTGRRIQRIDTRVLLHRGPDGRTRRERIRAAWEFRRLRPRPGDYAVGDEQLRTHCRKKAHLSENLERFARDQAELHLAAQRAELWAVPIVDQADAEPTVDGPIDDPAAPDDTGNRRPPPTLFALTRVTLTAAPPRRRARTTHPA